MKKLVDKLKQEQSLSLAEWTALFDHQEQIPRDYLFSQARAVTRQIYGNDIYVRGLIEFTNYCKNDCYYCGIRKSNTKAARYRLTKEQILGCCQTSYEAGFYTFVLQGGEDPYFTEERMVDIIRSIKKAYPDCAVTLSIGEKSAAAYRAYFEAGADRYLLRHETFLAEHYSQLHPPELSAGNRQECLRNLKQIGYQVGTGFMVGAPYQTSRSLAEDMLFIKELNPQMVGIGPFIPHRDTPFKVMPAGSCDQTLLLISLLRLMIPTLLLPSTTALGTIDQNGRMMGIRCGANVIMQNVTPKEERVNYTLYANKARAGDTDTGKDSPFLRALADEGYHISVSRGDSLNRE